ncbi:hypothetical protein [Roseateles flavus]|uniref:Uncharacterized protein n=1 Tax=Roseateles flavus TaxID=3149041 RepID=A0ABV0GL54_9BURK
MNQSTLSGLGAVGLRTAGQSIPNYLHRVARGVVIRSALRGRIKWPVARHMLRPLGQPAATGIPARMVQASAQGEVGRVGEVAA